MSYESRIYVVRKDDTTHPFDGGKRWAERIAMLNMCTCSPLSNILRDKPITDCFICADDGDTKIEEDCYGSPLTETSLQDAIQIVQKVIDNSPYDYWRYHVLLAMLQAIYEFAGDDKSFAVLHFGY